MVVISIHAPRTGSDDIVEWGGADELISIHAPRTGSDHQHRRGHKRQCRFQSTLPARGATHGEQKNMRHRIFQSTLPARGATDTLTRQNRAISISIHAPRTGSDGSSYME